MCGSDPRTNLSTASIMYLPILAWIFINKNIFNIKSEVGLPSILESYNREQYNKLNDTEGAKAHRHVHRCGK